MSGAVLRADTAPDKSDMFSINDAKAQVTDNVVSLNAPVSSKKKRPKKAIVYDPAIEPSTFFPVDKWEICAELRRMEARFRARGYDKMETIKAINSVDRLLSRDGPDPFSRIYPPWMTEGIDVLHRIFEKQSQKYPEIINDAVAYISEATKARWENRPASLQRDIVLGAIDEWDENCRLPFPDPPAESSTEAVSFPEAPLLKLAAG